MPHPSTAPVEPPTSSAPSWARASMPRAPPLVTTRPAIARPRASDLATSMPTSEGRRDPTIATRRCSRDNARPRQKMPTGGSLRRSSAGQYSGAPGRAKRAPASASCVRSAEGEARSSQSRSRSEPAAPARIARIAADAAPSRQIKRWSVRGEIPSRQRRSTTASASPGPSPNPGGNPLGTDWSSLGISAGTANPSDLVQRLAIRQRLADVVDVDAVRAGEIGDRSCHAKHAVEAAAGQRRLLDGSAEEPLRGRGEAGLTANDRPWQVRVAGDAERLVPIELAFARRHDPRAHRRGRLPFAGAEKLMFREARNGQSQIDPVEQRAGEFGPIARQLVV